MLCFKNCAEWDAHGDERLTYSLNFVLKQGRFQ